MSEDPLAFLAECIDVPIECTSCHALFPLGGNPEIWEQERPPTDEEIGRDLCDCGAPFRVYVSDAPPLAATKLAMLMDMLEMMPTSEKEAWSDSVRDDLEES